MTSFLELDEIALSDAQLIVDVDGTLVPDHRNALAAAVAAKLRRLCAVSDVYLCSNGSPRTATDIALQMGAQTFAARKPFPGTVRDRLQGNKRTVVIGDKYLTDGIFAAVLGAEFIRVPHMRASSDSWFVRASYFLDGAVWHVAPFVLALRPWQWIKNLLVFAPIFFAGEFFAVTALVHATLAAMAFSFVSSSMYVLNDLVDAEQDRLHPRKRFRPIASGWLGHRAAVALMVGSVALSVTAVSLIPVITGSVLVYVVINVLYSYWLKHIAVVDIACVAVFYLLRIVAGGLAAGVILSPWIMLCALFGALFVIIGKRRAEAQRMARRAVLDDYSASALDFMLSSSGALAIMAYGIYSVIGHDSPLLVYSTGFVAFALFRMLNRIYTHPEEAEAPEVLVFKDIWIIAAFGGWAAYVAWIFYVV